MTTKRKDSKGRILKDGEYQKKDGRYEYRFVDSSNVRRSVYSWKLTSSDVIPSGKKDSKDLRTLEKEINQDLSDGIVTNNKITLNNRYEAYMASRTDFRISTKAIYKLLYESFVQNSLGNKSIAEIKYSNIKNFFIDLYQEHGLKPNSIKSVYGLLHPIFSIAVRDGYIRNNPTDGILGELKRTYNWDIEKRHSLTIDQQKNFLHFVSNSKRFKYWYPLFVCLLGTGCRVGEMLGLTWKDINWEENSISITHTLIYRKLNTDKAQFYINDPKTKTGVRIIPMFKKVRKSLLEVYEEQMSNGFSDIRIGGYTGFIWFNTKGSLIRPNYIDDIISFIIKDYNKVNEIKMPHFSVHNLRHTFCSRLCENETDLKLIQEIMGHSDIQTTMNIYNESNIDRKRESFKKIESEIDLF